MQTKVLGYIQKIKQCALLLMLRKPSLFSVIVLFFVSCLLMLPIWRLGLPINAHDAKVHASWQYYFSTQLWAGDIYPKWLADMNEGLGSPSFFIYPPLSQYIASLLAPFSDSTAWVYQRIGIATTVAFFLSGVGTFLWLRKATHNQTSALVGALVFLASPYHLFIDTYYRAAYAELWAFAWAPFSILAVHLFRSHVKIGLIVYTVSTSALLFTHAPSCIVLLPLYIAYATLLSVIYKNKQVFLWTCLASCIAIMIAGAYLSTALTHQENINIAALFNGELDFSRFLLFATGKWSNKSMEMGITGTALFQLCVITLLGIFVIRRELLNRNRQILAGFTVAIAIITFFMMTSFSEPIWRAIPILQKIQFPWRLLLAQTICLALITSLFSVSVRSGSQVNRRRIEYYISPIVMLALLGINLAMTSFTAPKFSPSAPLRVRDAPEYHLGSIVQSNELFKDNETSRVLSGNGKVKIISMAPRSIRIHVESSTPLRFIVRHFYYPGWECTIFPGQPPCSVGKYEKRTPLITIDTGAGDQVLTIRMAPSLYEQIGFYASLAGLWLLGGLCIFLPASGPNDKVSLIKAQGTTAVTSRNVERY